jgi:signal transduction histidine kinase
MNKRNQMISWKRQQLISPSLLAALSLTCLVILSMGWNYHHEKQHTKTLAINSARSHFQKDQAFRQWATSHGGVYVPASERTTPNPSLSHIPERDMITPSGRQLTLMNPAYMLRQIMAEYPGLYGVKGHITSLKPLNPDNAPDEWETQALQVFETGVKEVMMFTEVDGVPHLRLIRPMMTIKGCLKCHEHQGYKVGEVRGGVGVMVPMKYYLQLESSTILNMIWSHIIFWLLGVAMIIILHQRNKQLLFERVQAEQEIRTLNASLEQRVQQRTAELAAANKELDAFAFSVSHDLRAPLRAIDGFSQAVLEGYGNKLDDQGCLLLGRMRENSKVLAGLIEGLLTLSRSTRGKLQIRQVDLSTIAAEVLAELQEAEPERRVDCRIDPNLEAKGDPRLMKALLENLIGNAWKFTAQVTGEAQIQVTFTEQKGQKVFQVRDNGAGFDMTYVNDLFKPFKRLHQIREFPGNGIGLATVQRIINRHQGHIWAEGRVGEGAVFTFTFGDVEADATIPKQNNYS